VRNPGWRVSGGGVKNDQDGDGEVSDASGRGGWRGIGPAVWDWSAWPLRAACCPSNWITGCTIRSRG